MKFLKLFAIMVLSFVAVGTVTACAGYDTSTLIESISFAGGAGLTIASLPIWFKMVEEVKTFNKLSEDELKELKPEELSLYHKAVQEDLVSTVEKLQTELNEAKSDDVKIEKLTNRIEAQKEMFDNLQKAMINQGDIISTLKDNGPVEIASFETSLKSAWDEGADKLKEAIDDRKTFAMTVKAEQTYGDINAGLDFAQFRPGVVDIPVRRPKIRDIFSTIPVSTEYLKYTEQNTVVRDAQNVAKCAAVVSTTKETLIVRSIETKVIKDMIDFCRLFVSDYPFMQSRINRLLTTSLALRIDSQLLLGDGLGENTFSIDSVASVFSAINPVCPVNASIQAANMVDLILAMETQIIELGQQEDFQPNVVLVNKCDWFKNVESLKDLNNNYLDARVTNVNGIPFINGMMVIWTPIVAADSLYVFDSTKGEVVDRQQVVLEVAFENRDNWEKEIATLKGYERLNFLVPNNWANAFMKTTTVAASIAAINKP